MGATNHIILQYYTYCFKFHKKITKNLNSLIGSIQEYAQLQLSPCNVETTRDNFLILFPAKFVVPDGGV
jgi:hypothetical protein